MRIYGLACAAAVLVGLCRLAGAEISEDDIVGYWPLDDGGGDEAADLSGNEHHGAITDGDWVAGQFGGGLAFNGTTTFMEVLHHEDFNLGANFTLAAWSFTNGLPQQHIGLPRKEAEYVLHPTQGGDAFNLRVYIGQGARGPRPRSRKRACSAAIGRTSQARTMGRRLRCGWTAKSAARARYHVKPAQP